MKITILGSGTCVPSLKRSSCAFLVQASNANILFDLGPGTMRRLLEAGICIHDISHVFLSHFHPDHTGELVSFLFANKYPDEYQRKIPLTLCGGYGFTVFFDQLKSIYKEWIDLSGRLRLVEFSTIGRDTHEFDGFKIDTSPMNHREESIAYKISTPNSLTMVYSGDTDYSENLIDLAKNADLLICECALPDNLKVPGHLTPSLAGKIAAAANVKKLVLTHFYPQCDDADIESQCRKTYSGPLTLAKDLMTFDLSIAS